MASRLVSIAATGLFLAGAMALSSTAQAQGNSPGSRAGKMEFLLPITYQNSVKINGENGSSADINSDLGMGLGFGYNFNSHFQLGGVVTWSTRSYDATLVNTDGTTQQASGYLDTSTVSLYGTWYILESDVTPYLTAGIGSTFVDSNIPDGTGSTACWWDPWWGYICQPYVPTKTETAVSYTAAAGVRWDITRVFALQGSYNKIWLDLSKSSPSFDGFRFDLIFRM